MHLPLSLWLGACRLDINVGVTTLDYPALLTEQRIKLSNQPHGSARCLFDEADFGRFLTHPLVMQATAKAVRGSPFVFDANSVVVHAPSSGEKPGTQGPQSQASAAAAASSVVHPTGTKATSASGAAVAGEVVGHLNQPSQDSLPSLADVNLPQGPTLTPPVMQPLSTPPSSSGSSSLSGPSPMHTHKKSELTGLGMDEAIGDPYFDPHAAGSAVTTGYITCTGALVAYLLHPRRVLNVDTSPKISHMSSEFTHWKAAVQSKRSLRIWAHTIKWAHPCN